MRVETLTYCVTKYGYVIKQVRPNEGGEELTICGNFRSESTAIVDPGTSEAVPYKLLVVYCKQTMMELYGRYGTKDRKLEGVLMFERAAQRCGETKPRRAEPVFRR